MTEMKPLVMVANDDEAVNHALQFALRLEGAEVCLHESGAGFLADPKLPEAACLVLKYHLVGMDGLEVLRRVRERGVAAPAIVLTSAATSAMKARAKAEGVWLLLEKPVMDDALVGAVAGLLREIT